MADETNDTQDAEATEAEATEDEATEEGRKFASVLARRANRSLRRAKKQYQEGDANEANYYLQEANVLALLDVAEAFRESQAAGE